MDEEIYTNVSAQWNKICYIRAVLILLMKEHKFSYLPSPLLRRPFHSLSLEEIKAES